MTELERKLAQALKKAQDYIIHDRDCLHQGASINGVIRDDFTLIELKKISAHIKEIDLLLEEADYQ